MPAKTPVSRLRLPAAPGFPAIAGLIVPRSSFRGRPGTIWDEQLVGASRPGQRIAESATALTEAVASAIQGLGRPAALRVERLPGVDAGRSARKDRTPGTCSTAGSRRPRRSAGSPRRYCRTQKSTSTRRRPRRRRPSRLRRHGGGSLQQPKRGVAIAGLIVPRSSFRGRSGTIWDE